MLRVNDPDTWRVAGWDDGPNHFVNFGRPDLGPFPFAALPRDYAAAVEKFGIETLKRIGTLPWREAEQFGNLRRAFEGFRRDFLYAPSDTVLFAAVASHYMQDAHMPLHASNNNDGQLTGQTGVHARFETGAVRAIPVEADDQPVAAIAPIANPRDAAFETLLASHQLVARLLQADKDAATGRDAYDDEYFDRFFAERAAAPRAADLAVHRGDGGAHHRRVGGGGKPVLRTAVPAATRR